jgi:hypothetical protein
LFNLKGLGRVYIIRPSYREYDDLKNLTVAQATLATPWIRPCPGCRLSGGKYLLCKQKKFFAFYISNCALQIKISNNQIVFD